MITRFRFPIIAAVIVAAFFAFPLQRAKADEVIKGDGGKIRLVFSPTGTNSFIPFAMKKFGLDKKHGFELEPVASATTQTTFILMQSGGAEVSTFDWNDISRLRNGGFKVVAVAPFLTFGADFYVAPIDSPVKTVADMKGHVIGTTSRNTLNWVILRVVTTTKYNFDVDKDSTVQEGAVTLLRGLGEAGKLDATAIFNSMAPDAVLSGKFRVVAKVSDLVAEVGLPAIPYLMYAFTPDYIEKHPQNVKAWVAAYQDTVMALRENDAVWLERAAELQMGEPALAAFRIEARKDILLKFSPTTEADIRKTFDVLLNTAGAGALGLNKLADGFMTLDFQ